MLRKNKELVQQNKECMSSVYMAETKNWAEMKINSSLIKIRIETIILIL